MYVDYANNTNVFNMRREEHVFCWIISAQPCFINYILLLEATRSRIYRGKIGGEYSGNSESADEASAFCSWI